MRASGTRVGRGQDEGQGRGEARVGMREARPGRMRPGSGWSKGGRGRASNSVRI